MEETWCSSTDGRRIAEQCQHNPDSDDTCFLILRGQSNKEEVDRLEIDISCYNTYGTAHKKCAIQLKFQNRIREGEKLEKLWAFQPAHFTKLKANQLLNDSGKNCPLLHTSAVYQKVRQEARDKFIGIDKYPDKEL